MSILNKIDYIRFSTIKEIILNDRMFNHSNLFNSIVNYIKNNCNNRSDIKYNNKEHKTLFYIDFNRFCSFKSILRFFIDSNNNVFCKIKISNNDSGIIYEIRSIDIITILIDIIKFNNDEYNKLEYLIKDYRIE